MADRKELFKEVEGKLYNFKNLEIQIKNIELDILKEKNQYRGCGAISYDERSGVTYNISRQVENEVISREKKIGKLTERKLEKEIEKQKIENALTCLDERDTRFFNLFYMSIRRPNMKYISRKLYIDPRHCYRIRNRIVYKMIDMLYPDIKNDELPLLKNT